MVNIHFSSEGLEFSNATLVCNHYADKTGATVHIRETPKKKAPTGVCRTIHGSIYARYPEIQREIVHERMGNKNNLRVNFVRSMLEQKRVSKKTCVALMHCPEIRLVVSMMILLVLVVVLVNECMSLVFHHFHPPARLFFHPRKVCIVANDGGNRDHSDTEVHRYAFAIADREQHR